MEIRISWSSGLLQAELEKSQTLFPEHSLPLAWNSVNAG